MAGLTTLPRELRQKILLVAVQQEDRFFGTRWPAWITDLLHVCKPIYHDMPWVISSWSPLWYFCRSIDMGNVQPLIVNGAKYWPRLANLYLDIFHETDLNDMIRVNDPTGEPYELYPELVQAWHDGVSRLPRLTVEKVSIDVTVAPGWARKDAPEWTRNDAPESMRKESNWHISRLLRSTRVGRFYIQDNIDGISRLSGHIFTHYEQKVTISFTGTLGRGTTHFKPQVSDYCTAGGIPFQFLVQYADVGTPSINRFVSDLAPKNKPPGMSAENWRRALRLAPLRRVGWSINTVQAFERVAAGTNTNTMGDVMHVMAESMVAEGVVHLEMAPSGRLHRVMIHNMARDMGLRTESQGVGEGRYVVVTK